MVGVEAVGVVARPAVLEEGDLRRPLRGEVGAVLVAGSSLAREGGDGEDGECDRESSDDEFLH